MKKILFLLLGLVLIVSCGDKGTKLKGKTVTFNIEAEPSSLDPQLLTDMGGFMISNATYENVVRLNEKNEIVPAGAESYTVSPDGKIWTFKLRKDAKWSNGDPVLAKDYVNGLKRGLDPKLASEYAYMAYYIKGAEDFNTAKTTDFSTVGVTAPDDYTVVYELSKPAAYFGKILILPIFAPVNAKALEQFKDKYETEASNSIYNGPYTMVEWVHDNKAVLVKNENYWNKDNIKIDNLVAMMTPDFDAAVSMYQNGEMDLTKISNEKIDVFKGKPDLQVHANGRVYYFGFNVTDDILKNIKIRKALSLAVDRNKLVSDVLRNSSFVGSGLVANGTPGTSGDFREENGNLYDQYKAEDIKKLFEEGLKELGKTPADVNLTLAIDEKGSAKKEAEYFQAQWQEKLGIKVNIESTTFKIRLEKGKNYDYQVIRYAWGPDYADPMTYLELLYSKSGAINITKYNNPEYDKLIELAQVNNDNAVRMDAMKKAEKIATEEFFYSGLYYESANYAVNPKIKNVVIRAVGAPVDFYYADLSE